MPGSAEAMEPVWFGDAEHRLAGWIHPPAEAVATAAVVLCGPLGLEYVNSHRGLRRLAEQLAAAGCVVLRFDYASTGDSAGSWSDDGLVERWQHDVLAAVDLVSDIVPSAPVIVVGLRWGATLAAHAAAKRETPFAGFVAWDPIVSGKNFVREQTLLGALSGTTIGVEGDVEAPGLRYSADTVRDLRAMTLVGPAGVAGDNVLLLRRERTSLPASVEADFSAAKATIVDGQDEWLGVASPESLVPASTIASIVSWVAERFCAGAPAHALTAATSALASSADIGAYDFSADGLPEPDGVITERVLRAGSLGLVAVESLPLDGSYDRTAVFLNNAAEHHVGPARIWTDAARFLARQGVRAIRADISGLGDSPTRENEPEDLVFSQYALSDVVDLLAGLHVDPASTSLIGLCSGAQLAMMAGRELAIKNVVAVNPATTNDTAAFLAGPENRYFQPQSLFRARVNRLLRRWALQSGFRAARQGWADIAPRVPAVIWRGLGAAGVTDSPAAGLFRRPPKSTVLICGPAEAYGFQTRGKSHIARLVRSGALAFELVPDLAHMPVSYSQRVDLIRRISAHVMRG
jgi:alpha/beta superfamily hydrolase